MSALILKSPFPKNFVGKQGVKKTVTHTEGSGQLDSAEEIAKACRRPIVCALPAPENRLTHQIGCRQGTKPKDGCTHAEVPFPKHIGIKRRRENNNMISGEQGQLDSVRVIAEACPHPIVCALATQTHPPVRQRGRPQKTGHPNAPPQGRRQEIGQAGKNEDSITITRDRGWLNSTIFGYYLEHMWNSFPEEKLRSMAYFEPLIFYSYVNGYANVINCIKRQCMFLKKYVVVPIVLRSHWNLLIFCHLGESLNSKTNTPCMLLLDSLRAYGAKSWLEPIIRRLLNDIYQSEERDETEEQLKRMPLLVPNVPQQNNGSDCGFYVLYYINLFINSAPENFNIFNGYPYFMKQDWFTAEEVESFRQKLDALPPDPDDATSYSTEDSDDGIESLGTKAPMSDALASDPDDATSYSTEDSDDGIKSFGKTPPNLDALCPDPDDATSYSAEDSDDSINFLGSKSPPNQ